MHRDPTRLHLFRKIFKGKEPEEEDSDNAVKDTDATDKIAAEELNGNNDGTDGGGFFFAKSWKKSNEDSASTVTETVPEVKPLTPTEKAKELKAQAERARLEAEKMDIVLTLNKIEKLEKELTSKAVADDVQKEGDIRNQLKSLKKKLDGDVEDNQESTHSENSTTNGALSESPGVPKKDLDTVLSAVVQETKEKVSQETMPAEEIEEKIEAFHAAPKFMQQLVVKAAGMEMDDLNVTALVLKLYDDDKTYQLENTVETTVEDVPEFSKEQIEEVLEAVKIVPQFVKNLYGDELKNNDTAIAIKMLEDEWRSGDLVVMPEITQKMIDDKLEEIKWMPQFLRGDDDVELAKELIKSDFRRNGRASVPKPASEDSSTFNPTSTDSSGAEKSEGNEGLFGSLFNNEQKSDTDQMVESLFPESTRKEGEEIKESQAVLFMSEVLAKDNLWAATEAPQKVSGGFLIRGSTRFETGAELMEAIDKNLSKSRVKKQVDCFYIFDPTPVTEEQMQNGDRPPVLFVTAPNVARDPAPIQRSLISAIAFGTIWYNSLLPYLLNDKYMKLADEQLALADASMPSNVDFLNDLSFPLFAATVGIQACHEIAHVISANSNGLNITIPTLVPSLGTGLTGAITSLQNPPKDKQALFDFAIVGPLTGMAVSTLFLYIGMAATVSMDAASYGELPALPLNLLRQSSLVGGIIESVSPGLLTVPDAALGSKALTEINIPLHPFAVAGYFGMMVNAVNLLPAGRTDGGRVATTLFGRSGAQLVSFLTFVTMFVQGVTGSDLLLFFFSFVVFFQSELEIPQRNEVDDMDFSRVLLATFAGCLVLLTLIPM